MTNEEKAKRYDEAIKKLRDLHDNYDEISNLVNFKQEIEEIFPELKENEDERIRKEIIHYILYKADGVSEEQEHSWITYLEKQKEQKPAGWNEEDEKMRLTCIDIMEHFPRPCGEVIGPWKDCIDWLKSLRPSKDCSSCAKHLEGYISGRIDAENKLLEQFGVLVTPEDELHIKPRWKPSEEQMSMLLAVINEPNNAGAESCHIALKSLYNDLMKLM